MPVHLLHVSCYLIAAFVASVLLLPADRTGLYSDALKASSVLNPGLNLQFGDSSLVGFFQVSELVSA